MLQTQNSRLTESKKPKYGSSYWYTGSAPNNQIQICKDIISILLNGYKGNLSFQLWDGRQVTGVTYSACSVIIRKPYVLRDLIVYRNLSRLVNAFLEDDISINGDIEMLFDLETHLKTLSLSWAKQWHLMRLALQLSASQHGLHLSHTYSRSKNNDVSSIAHHYDIGNSFYRLWLDPEMVYSCAYFKDECQSLADAQRDKLDYICRKLRLKPGQTLLDIGCGWGALAIHAARYYGVYVNGITLSQSQLEYALERVRSEGLTDKVKINLLDYRSLPTQVKYDRVVSVGMFEHIGIKNYPVYFGKVKNILKSGGLFLNHGITSKNGWKNTPMTRFINQYIFPDGELSPCKDVVVALENAGFEILDMEGLRRHYVYTLRHWIRRLESNRDEAIHSTSEEIYRLWQLYMAGSAYYFNEGSIGVYQFLVGHQHDPINIPLRRDDLYNSHDN